MAERAKIVYTDQPGALPAEYVVPDTLDLDLSSVVARFDGSGAASAFLAVLSLYSSDNRLVTRARSDQVFAAGDTGVVTFAPF